MNAVTFAAAVLAGGHSVRMGRDKALLPHPVDGHPMVLRQLNLLRSLHPTQFFVSARTGQILPELPAAAVRVDDDGTCGPLGGLAALHPHVTVDHLLVIAVDLPAMTAAVLNALLAKCTSTAGVVARSPAGTEPLVAVYPRTVFASMTAAMRAGRLSLRRWVDDLHTAGKVQLIPFDDAALFRNWNAPTDT